MLLTKLDWLGKTAWLAITGMAFMVVWSLGLPVFAHLAGSGRLQAWFAEYAGAPGTWFNLLATTQGSRCPPLSGGSLTRGWTLQELQARALI